MKDRKDGWAISDPSMLGFLGITVGLINLAVDIFGYLYTGVYILCLLKTIS